MILYDYDCNNCGQFSAWNSINNSAKPISCPTCHASSKRIIAAPYLADMDDNNRIAHYRNEKSAHEPEFVKMINGKKKPCHHGSHAHQHIQRHAHPKRPWMIGH